MSRRRRRKRRNRGRNPAPDSAKIVTDFWGSADKLPEVEKVPTSIDSYAVIRSLGRPPFSGHEVISEHYLRTVCYHASKLAEALATAGGIVLSSDNGREDSTEDTSKSV